MMQVVKVVRCTVLSQQPKELCHHVSSEMSLECSRVFVKRSVVNENWHDSVKVQKFKQELNRSDLCRLTGAF